MKKSSRFFLLLISGCLLLAIFLWSVNLYIVNSTKQSIYAEATSIPARQAAIVLGAQVYRSGKLSRILEDRVRTGLELYRRGEVSKILVSGDHGRRDYDEVNAMRNYLLREGVPEQDVFMDHAGFDTYDSIYRAKAIFRIKNAVIVTQAFHLPRSLFIAKHLGVSAVGVPADRRSYSAPLIRHVKRREVLARAKTWCEVMIHRRPKFLGETIPITGDGRATVDHVKAE